MLQSRSTINALVTACSCRPTGDYVRSAVWVSTFVDGLQTPNVVAAQSIKRCEPVQFTVGLIGDIGRTSDDVWRHEEAISRQTDIELGRQIDTTYYNSCNRHVDLQHESKLIRRRAPYGNNRRNVLGLPEKSHCGSLTCHCVGIVVPWLLCNIEYAGTNRLYPVRKAAKGGRDSEKGMMRISYVTICWLSSLPHLDKCMRFSVYWPVPCTGSLQGSFSITSTPSPSADCSRLWRAII